MAEDAEDKTEEPTSKKLEKAREDGNVAQTQEAKIFAALIAVLIIVGMLAPGMGSKLKLSLTPFFEQPHTMTVDAATVPRMFVDIGMIIGKVLLFPVVMTIVLLLLANVSQSKGFLWVPKKLVPDFQRLDPWSGIKRLASLQQLMEVFKSVLKITIVGGLMGWLIWRHAAQFQGLPSLDLLPILDYIEDQVYWLTFATVMLVALLAAGDYFFQHWRWMEKMRMTKQEVKDEHKNQDGDPQIKGRLRAIRMARARSRMMAAVPKADVVVTNPTHYAVALKYDPDSMGAPVLVAKGVDLLAKRIRELATDNDVPIVENPPLARALYASVDLDHEIPPEHYKTVAEVIGYVMKLKGKLVR